MIGVDRTLVSHWIHGKNLPIPTSKYWPILLDELCLSTTERIEAHKLAGVDPLWLLPPEERAQQVEGLRTAA